MTDYIHMKCGEKMVDIRKAFQNKVFLAGWCAGCKIGIIQPYRRSHKFGFTLDTYSRVHDKLKDLQDSKIYLCAPRYLRDVLKLDGKTLETYLSYLMQENPKAIWYSQTSTGRIIEISKDIPLTSVFLDYTHKHLDV